MTTYRRLNSRGHTLLEMMLSLVLLSIVAASVSSVVIFASKADPPDTSTEATLSADAAAMARIAEDLALARYVIEQGENAVTVVVADRTGDGNPDRIRYAWSGTDGDPLTYQLNDNNAISLIDAIAQFKLEYTTTQTARTLPAAVGYGSESLIDSYTYVNSGSSEDVRSGSWWGQVITPSLSSNAVSFTPTRFEIYAEKNPTYNGYTLVELRDRSGATPGSSVYGTRTVDENELTISQAWNELAFTTAATVDADQDIALVFSYISGNNDVMELSRQNDGLLGLGGSVGGLLSSSDGSTWSVDGSETFVYRLYGRENLVDERQYDVTHQHLTQINVTLQSVADNRSPLLRTVRLMLAPQDLAGFAETGFDDDPTVQDIDADGNADFSHSYGDFPDASLQNGLWACDGTLIYDDKSLLTAEVVSVTARMRANDTLGPVIEGPHTVNGDGDLLPIITQLRDDGRGGQELVIYNDTAMAEAYAVIGGLDAGLVDIEMVLVIDQDIVYIEVNNEPAACLRLERIRGTGTVASDIRFGSSGGVAEFGSVYIRVGGSDSASSDTSGAISVDVFGLELF